ncbi:MAG: hypothetical protein PHN64_00955 [Desulfovibrionaceae bacterium]|nr:hypothetical protein [Desulfovibrionaceae bacterium]
MPLKSLGYALHAGAGKRGTKALPKVCHRQELVRGILFFCCVKAAFCGACGMRLSFLGRGWRRAAAPSQKKRKNDREAASL